MTKATNLTNVGENIQFVKLTERFSNFLLKTRKRNLALVLRGDDDFSSNIVGGDFARFEQDLTNGLELTSYDQSRIQARVRSILKS
ncbi:hypothetical protein [Roseovarius sp. EL26]|uniref:hypothetical protein n=1 Tax=Roseovarius sp. EL26 TaxID=2126672 RepID=UPI000EA37D94|nr:hypothetical protein [Roseovarius sp. EL26]